MNVFVSFPLRQINFFNLFSRLFFIRLSHLFLSNLFRLFLRNLLRLFLSNLLKCIESLVIKFIPINFSLRVLRCCSFDFIQLIINFFSYHILLKIVSQTTVENVIKLSKNCNNHKICNNVKNCVLANDRKEIRSFNNKD